VVLVPFDSQYFVMHFCLDLFVFNEKFYGIQYICAPFFLYLPPFACALQFPSHQLFFARRGQTISAKSNSDKTVAASNNEPMLTYVRRTRSILCLHAASGRNEKGNEDINDIPFHCLIFNQGPPARFWCLQQMLSSIKINHQC
jgi:hypothetical protein